MLAHGARCSIGDQLHPRGNLDRAAYRLIGDVYRYVEACEPWCDGAVAATEIAVLRATGGEYHTKPGGTEEGVVRAAPAASALIRLPDAWKCDLGLLFTDQSSLELIL